MEILHLYSQGDWSQAVDSLCEVGQTSVSVCGWGNDKLEMFAGWLIFILFSYFSRIYLWPWCTFGLWLSDGTICFLSSDVGWLTLLVLGICRFWGCNIGLIICGDCEKTLGLSNRAVAGTFLLKPTLPIPLLMGTFVGIFSWFVEAVLCGNWDIIIAAFSGFRLGSKDLSCPCIFPTVIPSFSAPDLVWKSYFSCDMSYKSKEIGIILIGLDLSTFILERKLFNVMSFPFI